MAGATGMRCEAVIDGSSALCPPLPISVTRPQSDPQPPLAPKTPIDAAAGRHSARDLSA